MKITLWTRNTVKNTVADKATNKRSAKRKKSIGQGLLEFALIQPILLMLIFGIMDFGWMIFNYSQLYHSLREGVRFASVPGVDATPQYKQCDAIRQRVIEMAGWAGLKPSDIVVIYDDGRSITTGNKEQVGTCAAGTTFAKNSTHLGTDGSGQRDLVAGDRVLIYINKNVSFLTPFLSVLAPTGVNMQLNAARSLYPNGLIVQ